MVLDASDYDLSNAWSGRFNPTNPRDLVGKLAGLVIAASFALWALRLASTRGSGTVNSVMSSVSGGLLDASGQDGGLELV